ncbi:MAG: hypothetical protein M3Q07_01265, partial [Pseudobdellovibrionaceae bacterium]|nr:hypothetical protein [Pseudobdellovibrionaceae bacterium]
FNQWLRAYDVSHTSAGCAQTSCAHKRLDTLIAFVPMDRYVTESCDPGKVLGEQVGALDLSQSSVRANRTRTDGVING